MKAVLISIQPKWCELIANGKKTVEVRKTRPKIATPFKCYIYCTNKKPTIFVVEHYEGYAIPHKQNGKVIGEFICNGMMQPYSRLNLMAKESCLTVDELHDYSNGKAIYGWHISDLKIYDKPRELREFKKPCKWYEKGDEPNCFICNKSGYTPDMQIDCFNTITSPPQSWCYVES